MDRRSLISLFLFSQLCWLPTVLADSGPDGRQVIYSRVDCKRNQDVRVLEVESSAEERCRLTYTIGRKRKKIPLETTEMFACRKERDRIREKLISANFACDEPVDPYPATASD